MDGRPRADNFSTVLIDLGDRPAFDANSYSFFGDMTNDDVSALGLEGGLETLDGALEDGLEAPPEEIGLEDAGLPYDDLPKNLDEGDLSLATMLLNQARLRDQESDLSTFTLEPPSSMQRPPMRPHEAMQAPAAQKQQQVAPQRAMISAADLEAQMFSQAAQQQQQHASSVHGLLRMGPPLHAGQQPLSPPFGHQLDGQFSLHCGGPPPPHGTYPPPQHPGMPPPPYPPQIHHQPPPFLMGMPPRGMPPPYPGSPGLMPPPGPPPPPGLIPPGGGPPPPPYYNGIMSPPPYGAPPHPPHHPGGGPPYPPRPPPPPGMIMSPGPPPPHPPQGSPLPPMGLTTHRGGVSVTHLEARMASQAAAMQQATGSGGGGSAAGVPPGGGAWDMTSGSGAGMSLAEIMRQQQQDSVSAVGHQHNWQQQQQLMQHSNQHQFPGGGHPMSQHQGPYGHRTSGSGVGNFHGTGTGSQLGSQQRRYSGSGGVRGRRAGGKFMSAEEVDHIMHIMYAAVNNGLPYAEDYYYQAVVNAHFPGRNDAMFEPQELRDLAEGVARLDPSASVKFVPGIEGLGKIVYSNLRTPRVLLDFSAAATAAASPDGTAVAAVAAAAAPVEGSHRPLNQEPLLAARIMIEDCLNLLLDVDDIDRIFKAAAARGAAAADDDRNPPSSGVPEASDDLLQRRALLLAGITSSFRLPTTPTLPSPEGGDVLPVVAAAMGDGIFHRVMVLAKGRNVLARTLRVLAPPSLPPLPDGSQRSLPTVPNLDPVHLLWAALRGSALLFGGNPGSDASADRALVESSARVAVGAIAAIDRLQDPSAISGCLEALCAGLPHPSASPPGGAARSAAVSGILPLVKVTAAAGAPGQLQQQQQQQPVWMGEVVVKLLRKGEELGFRVGGGAAPAASVRWRASLSLLVAAVSRHLEALQAVNAAASAASNADALRAVSALAARSVVAAVAEQASDEARAQLRSLALTFVA